MFSHPQVVFAKRAHYALPDLASSGYDVIQIDWTMDPKDARYLLLSKVVISPVGRVCMSHDFIRISRVMWGHMSTARLYWTYSYVCPSLSLCYVVCLNIHFQAGSW